MGVSWVGGGGGGIAWKIRAGGGTYFVADVGDVLVVQEV